MWCQDVLADLRYMALLSACAVFCSAALASAVAGWPHAGDGLLGSRSCVVATAAMFRVKSFPSRNARLRAVPNRKWSPQNNPGNQPSRLGRWGLCFGWFYSLTWTSKMAKIVDPILPIPCILGYWSIILGSFGGPGRCLPCNGLEDSQIEQMRVQTDGTVLPLVHERRLRQETQPSISNAALSYIPKGSNVVPFWL